MSLVRRWGVLALGVILAIVGVILVTRVEPTDAASFGWFAYAPLSHTTFTPNIAQMTGTFVPGLVILGIAIALIAGWVGFRLARRAR